MSTKWSLVVTAGVIVYVALNIFALALMKAASLEPPQGPSEVDDASAPHRENSLHFDNR